MSESPIELRDWVYIAKRSGLSDEEIREIASAESDDDRETLLSCAIDSHLITTRVSHRNELIQLIAGGAHRDSYAVHEKEFIDRVIYPLRTDEQSLNQNDTRALGFVSGMLELGIKKGTIFTLPRNQKGVLAFLTNNLAKICERLSRIGQGARTKLATIQKDIGTSDDVVTSSLDIDPQIVKKLLQGADDLVAMCKDPLQIDLLLGELQQQIEEHKQRIQELDQEKNNVLKQQGTVEAGDNYRQKQNKYAKATEEAYRFHEPIMEVIADPPAFIKKLQEVCERNPINLPMKLITDMLSLANIHFDDFRSDSGRYHRDTPFYRGIAARPASKILLGRIADEKMFGRSDDYGKDISKIIIDKPEEKLAGLEQKLREAIKQLKSKQPSKASGAPNVIRSFSELSTQVNPQNQADVETLELLLSFVSKQYSGMGEKFFQSAAKARQLGTEKDALTNSFEKQEESIKGKLFSENNSIQCIEADMRNIRSWQQLQNNPDMIAAVEASQKSIHEEVANNGRPVGLYMLKTLLMISDQRQKIGAFERSSPSPEYFSLKDAYRDYQNDKGKREYEYPTYSFSSEGSQSRHDVLHYNPQHMLYLEFVYSAFLMKHRQIAANSVS